MNEITDTLSFLRGLTNRHRKPKLSFSPTSRAIALLVLVFIALTVSPVPATAQEDGRLTVELNKLEQGEGTGCRAYFLFRNRTDMTFQGFEISLAILDRAGVIDRLLAIDAAPLLADRTTLKLFEVPEIACADISEVLLHELTACAPQTADPMDCFPIVDLVSRADAGLTR
jgi:hypothetical protein